MVTPGSGVRLRGSCWRRDTSRSNITSPLTTYCSTLYPPSPLSGIEGHPCAQNAALGGHRLASPSVHMVFLEGVFTGCGSHCMVTGANQVSRDILINPPVMDRDNGEEPGNKTRGQVRTAEIDQYWL